MEIRSKKIAVIYSIWIVTVIFICELISTKNSKLTLDLSNKNSNMKCEYAIISIMIHLYRGRIKHKKLLSKKRGGKPIASKQKETSNWN